MLSAPQPQLSMMSTSTSLSDTITHNGTHVLLVEDDPNLGSVLQEFLELKGFTVVRVEDGLAGIQRSQVEQFGLCILDIMLPKRDGFAVARELRAMNNNVPIIFLTARSRVEDKVEGFSAGGDDYLTKPFSMEELMMRIKAVLRRSRESQGLEGDPNHFRIGRYQFDYQKRILNLDDSQHTLTSREADLLRLLAQHLNSVVRRDIALKQIWGDDSYFNARSMDVFISKLRKYLSADEQVRLMNVHGIGYKLLVG